MNLVMMVLDTLRYDVVHHRGITHVHTPNLDALRRDSVSFSAAFGEGEPTIPVRRALMTGIRSYPWRYEYDTQGGVAAYPGLAQNPTGSSRLSPEILVERGYKTALIGDVYHIFKPTMNFTRGLGELGVRARAGERTTGRAARSTRSAPRPSGAFKGPFTPQEQAVLVQYLLKQAGVCPSGRPDLRYRPSAAPSNGWKPTTTTGRLPSGWRPSIPTSHGTRRATTRIATAPISRGRSSSCRRRPRRSAPSWKKIAPRPCTTARITYMDEWIGRLLDTLASLGRLEDTVVMFTSDHGTELLDHDRFGKSAPALHPYTTQLNWLVRHPSRVAGGQELTTFVQGHDILPTALDMLDIAEPERDDTAAALAGRRRVAADSRGRG